MIRAKAWSDDHNVEVEFDATAYFQQATLLDILQLAACGWARDYPADDVAMYVADQPASDGQGGHSGLQRLFQYLEIIAKDPMKKDCRGFECEIDRQDVLDWVGVDRPHLAQAIGQVEERASSPEDVLEKLPKKRFRVRLARTETRRLETILDAADAGHARIKALDKAGDRDFTAGTSGEPEYIVEMIEALGPNDDPLGTKLKVLARQLIRNARPDLRKDLARLKPEQVIARLGPYTLKDASHIGQSGHDVISDKTFINVGGLEDAEKFCRAFNTICEQHEENHDNKENHRG